MLRKTNCYIPELEPIDFIFQLFVGTVAFTVLLFLYPTTLMYFSVFKSVESVLTVFNFLTSALVSGVSRY